MKYQTRWLFMKEFEALEKVVEYLAEERDSYEACRENGQRIHNHIWHSLKILAAYVEEIEDGFQAIGSAIEEKQKRDRREGRPPEGLPDEMTISTRKPHRKRARPSLKASFKEA